MISYRSNFTGLPAPAPAPRQAPDPQPSGSHNSWKGERVPWSEEDLACFERLLELGLRAPAAAVRMGRNPNSAAWAVDKLRRRRARAQAQEQA